ncbi:hypothetical protein [Bradyrhizobium nitroreducens]|uniref:hypothetical protein n=1 Tax=Bradyrhizobium nitroreducens TaxID=709803 RepID=UPI0011AE8218|nr:hypothetical protein [Bradyrhizobium nitroreducens]
MTLQMRCARQILIWETQKNAVGARLAELQDLLDAREQLQIKCVAQAMTQPLNTLGRRVRQALDDLKNGKVPKPPLVTPIAIPGAYSGGSSSSVPFPPEVQVIKKAFHL